MIFYAIEALRDTGIRDIIISLSYHRPNEFVTCLGDGKEFGVNLSYVIHGEPKGIAYAINHARPYLGEKFMVYLGDNIFETSLGEYVERFDESKFDALILFKKVDDPSRYGVPKLDEKMNLVHLIEKPKVPPSPYALLGAYFFTSKFFEVYPKIKPSWRGEYEITDMINLLMPNVDFEIYRYQWWDLGTPSDILDCVLWLKDKEEKGR